MLVFYAWLVADGSLQDFAIDFFGGGVMSLTIALILAPAIFFFLNRLEGHVRFLPLIAGTRLPVRRRQGAAPVAARPGAGLRPAAQQSAPRQLEPRSWPRCAARATTRRCKEFKGLVAELTFATKSFFFLLLGYWTDLGTMRSWTAWAIAVAVFGVVYVSRYAILRLLRQRDARIADVDRAARPHHRAAVPRGPRSREDSTASRSAP